MSNIKERLDKLKTKFTEENFLTNKGLGNEVGIYIFSYDPEDEMVVRYFLSKIKNETAFNAIPYDLYDIFNNYLADRKLLNRVEALEERSGREIVEKQLKTLIKQLNNFCFYEIYLYFRVRTRRLIFKKIIEKF